MRKKKKGFRRGESLFIYPEGEAPRQLARHV
jgi:hypothetical protein